MSQNRRCDTQQWNNINISKIHFIAFWPKIKDSGNVMPALTHTNGDERWCFPYNPKQIVKVKNGSSQVRSEKIRREQSKRTTREAAILWKWQLAPLHNYAPAHRSKHTTDFPTKDQPLTADRFDFGQLHLALKGQRYSDIETIQKNRPRFSRTFLQNGLKILSTY